MSERVPAIKVLLLPKDTNALGTIFGGVILSHVDLASAVEARRVAPHRYVTKATASATSGRRATRPSSIVWRFAMRPAAARLAEAERRRMREVEFHAPVYVGDIVNFFTETVRVGQTSVTVKVLVEVERWSGGHGEHEKVTEAEVVLVAIGPDGRPIPVRPGAGPA